MIAKKVMNLNAELIPDLPVRAPSWQQCYFGTFPDTRKWQFPALCFELAPVAHHRTSHSPSSHV